MLISCLKHETQAAVLNTAFIICDSKKEMRVIMFARKERKGETRSGHICHS